MILPAYCRIQITLYEKLLIPLRRGWSVGRSMLETAKAA